VVNAFFVQSLKCQHSISHFPNLSPAFLIPFISVEPDPRTPYIGCYATYVDPISWILVLFYDTGADCGRSWQPGLVSLKICALVMFDVLMVIPALRACELFPGLVRLHNFSEMIRSVARSFASPERPISRRWV